MEEKIRTKEINAIVKVRGWEFVEHYDTVLVFNDKGDEIMVEIYANKHPMVWWNKKSQSDTLNDVFPI